MKDGQAGEPGEPGKPGEGKAGGAGGAGGHGGAGSPEGEGGRGGHGGAGGEGAKGERGERGPVNHLAVIGYVILVIVLFIAFARGEQIANEQQNQIAQAAIERAETKRRFEETAARLATSDERQHEAIRTILCLAARQTQTSRQRTPEEKAQSAAFYREALESINARPCDKEAP